MKKLFKPLLYILIAVITVVLSVNASENIEAYLKFYGENKAYCDDIRKDVPLNKSQKAKEGVLALTDKLTSFALSFCGENAFADMPSILSEIEKAERYCKDTTETEIYFCNECIRENRVKKEYVEKGYIILRSDKTANVIYEGVSCFAETDEEKIIAENERLLKERTENIKRTSLTYSQLSDYIEKLENTEYAVYDGRGSLLLTNSDEKAAEEAEKYFRSKKDHIILQREQRDEHASFSESLTFLADGFVFPEAEEEYLLLLSTDEGLDFDGGLYEAESFYKNTEAELRQYTGAMRSSILLCFLPLAAALIISMLASPAKNKKSVRFAFCLCFSVLVLSVIMTVFDSKTVIEALASSDPIKLSASLSAAAVKLFVPLAFLSAEGLAVSTAFLIKK